MSDFSEHDEPTRLGAGGAQRRPQPGYWQSAGAPHDVPAYGASPTPPPGNANKRRWLIPLLLVACAAISFAIVMLVMNRDDGGSSAAPSPAQAGTERSMTQQTMPQQSTSSGASTSSASASSGVASTSSAPTSSASSSVAAAAFPAVAVATCGGGPLHPQESREPLGENVRVSTSDEGTPSCEFVRKVQGDVASALMSDPSASQFTFEETSVRQTRAPYPVTCTRSAHLSTCRVSNSAPHDYVIYVRDSVG